MSSLQYEQMLATATKRLVLDYDLTEEGIIARVREAIASIPCSCPDCEPDHSCDSGVCPDCQRPSQFGERCQSCRDDEQARILQAEEDAEQAREPESQVG